MANILHFTRAKFFNIDDLTSTYENSISDARTPQPGEKVFNTMRYISSETLQRLGTLSEQCQLHKSPNNV